MKYVLMVLAVCVFAGTAQAELTKEQKAKHKEWQAALDDKSTTENTWPKEMCGKDFPMTIDPSIVAPFMEAGNEAMFYCREVREKLSTMCRNAKDLLKYGNGADNKKLITSKINKIVCTHSKKAEDDVSYDIKGGVLTVSLGAKASNISENLISYLYKTQGFNDGELRPDKK